MTSMNRGADDLAFNTGGNFLLRFILTATFHPTVDSLKYIVDLFINLKRKFKKQTAFIRLHEYSTLLDTEKKSKRRFDSLLFTSSLNICVKNFQLRFLKQADWVYGISNVK